MTAAYTAQGWKAPRKKFLLGTEGAEADLHYDTMVWFRGAIPPPPVLTVHSISQRTTKLMQWGNVSAPGTRRASFVTRAPPVDCCR